MTTLDRRYKFTPMPLLTRRKLHPNVSSVTRNQLVVSLLKGAVRLTTKPPKPRVSWDIEKVLDYIRERYDVDIGIAEQGRLVVTLIALVSSWRPGSDLGRITLSSLLFSFGSGDQHSWEDLPDAYPPVSVTFSA
jgi:hypothetical protein